jgi:asparagine synthase (glutamine-hydrolysing)
MTYLDLNLRLPELLLMRVDKMSMGVSLEGRVPFLDHKFVELAMSIPTAVKTRNGELKHILKKAVRGVIPDEIIDRPKQGFGVPFTNGRSAARRSHRSRAALVLPANRLPRLARVQELKARGEGQLLWVLLNVALWWKSSVQQDTPELMAAS